MKTDAEIAMQLELMANRLDTELGHPQPPPLHEQRDLMREAARRLSKRQQTKREG